MPELPEVETVRAGLERHVVGARVLSVEVLRDYSVRRHDPALGRFADLLVGRVFESAARRGKFLWLPLAEERPGNGAGEPRFALLGHLGMSGQLLVRDAQAPGPHVRVRLVLQSDERRRVLDFVDQRTFGHLSVQRLVPTQDGSPGGLGSPAPTVPVPVQHIARDLLDPCLDREALAAAIRARRTGIKRALLDQQLVSGIGNIYADEALWGARLHYDRRAGTLRRTDIERLLDAATHVMTRALAEGGTSFDSLYVNVNGASGYFSRALAVYGREGEPCPRCGHPVRREAFMNRSAFFCPRCQPRPPKNPRPL